MSHKCQIDGSNAACFDVNGELWVKEYSYGNEREGRTYKVNFCPKCGFKIPEKKFFSFLHAPYQEPDEHITRFSHALSTAIAQMNHNVELMKCFMSSQNTQNECFMDRDLETSKEIVILKERIKILEDKVENGH